MVLFSPDLQQQTGSTLQLDQTTMQLDWTRLGWIYFLLILSEYTFTDCCGPEFWSGNTNYSRKLEQQFHL